MKTRLWMLLLAAAAILACGQTGPFIEKPYLQLGQDPTSPQNLALMWQAASSVGDWSVEVGDKGEFRKMAPPQANEISVKGTPIHVVYTAKLTGLGPAFDYRVSLDGKVVFRAKATGRPAGKAPYSFVAFGDSGGGTAEQKEIAALTHRLEPGMVFVTGDIVYTRGLISEYRTKHFPVYNADQASPTVGAPLTRSVPMIAAAGNHDIATRDLGKYPDALPYFYYWSMPLNGPEMAMFGKLEGDAERIADFRKGAGANFSRMANYSFDWGNSHWLVLDSNNYVDWSNAEFQKWVAADLAASKATWKFVGYHHPGFNSSKAHFNDQQVRLMAPIFEKYGVDVVFAGHVHNYQRTYPLQFQPQSFDLAKSRQVNGSWILDRDFDGVDQTKPKGVIYLVTGAGGNKLYDPEQEDDRKSWQEFTVRFVSKIHSLTHVRVDGKKAVFQQLDKTGKEVDRFTLTK